MLGQWIEDLSMQADRVLILRTVREEDIPTSVRTNLVGRMPIGQIMLQPFEFARSKTYISKTQVMQNCENRCESSLNKTPEIFQPNLLRYFLPNS